MHWVSLNFPTSQRLGMGVFGYFYIQILSLPNERVLEYLQNIHTAQTLPTVY